MIFVDTALEQRERAGRPIRVAIVGAGYMGRGVALELLTPIVGMRLAAVAGRTLAGAAHAYREGGVDNATVAESVPRLEDAVAAGRPAITDDARLVCEAEGIDVVIEATGDVEFGAWVALRAIECGKHVVLNAEVDATVGPILNVYARRAGVVLTGTDGDEPGVAMNLYRFVTSIGYRPVLVGNVKGLLDPHRTPETQEVFATQHGQKPRMVTAAADGTKLAMEATILANATGFRVARRGMYGHRCAHVREAQDLYPLSQLLEGGLVDYVLGAEPGTGAFVLVYTDHPVRQRYLSYFKMGNGPLYVLYTPYHLPHLQVVPTIARAALFQDATVAPRAGPVCDVLAVAKRDLEAGAVLDGIGGFTCYGTIDNADTVCREELLPMGLSEGCRVRRSIAQDRPIAYADVELPGGRLCDRLRAEQDAQFALPAQLASGEPGAGRGAAR